MPQNAPAKNGLPAFPQKARILALFLRGRIRLAFGGMRGELRRLAQRLEGEVFPRYAANPESPVALEASESGGRQGLRLAGEKAPLENTARFAGFLQSLGVRRLELDPSLEEKQIRDVFEVLAGMSRTLRMGRAGFFGRLFGSDRMLRGLMGDEGVNFSCATVHLRPGSGVLRVRYTFCRLVFSRAAEAFRKRGGAMRDHRAFFRAAPRFAALAALVVALPLVVRLMFIERPAVWITVDLLVALAVGVTVFLLLETLGSLEYDKENQESELARQHRLLTGAYAKIQRDVAMARKIQTALLPPEHYQPFADRLRTAFWYQPEMAVGGDYFDMRVLDEQRLGLLIVDVSGHGMAAAFITGQVKMALEMRADESESPGAFLDAVNDSLCRFTPMDSFATIAYLTYNVETRRLLYANAGHSPRPVLLRSGGELHLLDEPAGLPAGVEEAIRYEDGETVLGPGDCLVLATDGIPEAMNPAEDVWGEAAFADFLRANADAEPTVLCERLREAVRAHEAGASPRDDQTAAAVRVLE